VKVNAMQSALDSAIKETVVKLSKKYEFDYQEALAFLGVEEKLRVTIGAKAKEPRAAKREQPKFPLPFSGHILENCCVAVLYNKGLYSQCLNEPGSDGLCSSCFKKAEKTAFGKPEYGTIDARLEQGDDFTDYKGKKPVHFTQIMRKLQLTEELVLSEVTKFQFPFDTKHFVEPQVKKGRPKKEATKPSKSKKATNQIEVSVLQDDLLATLAEENDWDEVPTTPTSPPPTTPPTTLPTAPTLTVAPTLPSAPTLTVAPTLTLAPALPTAPTLKMSASALEDGEISDITDDDQSNTKPQKEAKKAEKEAKRLEKDAEKAKKEAKRLEKDAEKAKKEAEKEAKRLEKEAKEAEKAKKEAEKEAKRLEKERLEKERLEKERLEKERLEKESVQKVSNDELSVEKFDDESVKAAAPKARKVTYNGKQYVIRLSDNLVFDPVSKYEVGYWNPTEKTIVLEEEEEDEDEEEEEEELAEDSDEE